MTVSAPAIDATATARRGAVSVVVLTWNGREDTLACLATLAPQLLPDDRVFVVDNGSTDGTEACVRREHPDLTLLQNGRNLGFAGGNNAGLRAALAAGTPWVFVLNNDTLLDPGALDTLVASAEAASSRNPRLGVVQPVLVRADDPETVDSCGQQVGRGPAASDLGAGRAVATLPDEPVPIFGACAAAALVHRDVLVAAGVFDESLFVLFEDTDLAFRIRAEGYDTELCPAVRVRHRRGVSARRRDDVAGQKRRFWVQRNIVTLALRWWPAWSLVRAAPVLLFRAADALRLSRRHRFGPCRALWRAALRDRPHSRRQLRAAGGDTWFGRDPLAQRDGQDGGQDGGG